MNLPSCDPEDVDGERADIEFKAQFDPASRQDWCELIKDIVAIANSGGGTILIGVDDAGTPTGHDVAPVLALDAADVTNKIYSYTDQQFATCRIDEGHRRGKRVAVIRIGAARLPLVFTSPGTYPSGPASQKTAFARGTVYFRHGPKSEPATTADIAAVVEREVARVKEFWLDGIAKVVAAPPNAVIQVLPQAGITNDQAGQPNVRLTTDDDAPVFKVLKADNLYPYRQTELLKKLRASLPSAAVGAHDLLCVRRVYDTDENPNFSHKSQWSPRQYSEAFVEWLFAHYADDADFFRKAREKYRQSSGGEPRQTSDTLA